MTSHTIIHKQFHTMSIKRQGTPMMQIMMNNFNGSTKSTETNENKVTIINAT